jgi:hypothetical protein
LGQGFIKGAAAGETLKSLSKPKFFGVAERKCQNLQFIASSWFSVLHLGQFTIFDHPFFFYFFLNRRQQGLKFTPYGRTCQRVRIVPYQRLMITDEKRAQCFRHKGSSGDLT